MTADSPAADSPAADSPAAPSARQVVASNLARVRAKVGMASAQDLADRIKTLGGRLDRAAISKIETGSRNVSLDELILLAAALDVAPVHLMTPPAPDAEFSISPKAPVVTALRAREWIRGRQPLEFTDEKTYRSAWVADEEFVTRNARVANAEERVAEAEHRSRVARALLDEISDDLARRDSIGRSTRLTSDGLLGPSVLERNLTLAYERLAEARVDLQDARRVRDRARHEAET